MSLFGRGGDSVDIIDYTELQRRGILKLKAPEPSNVKVDSQGFVDLGSVKQEIFSPVDSSAASAISASGLLADNSSDNSSASSPPSSSFASFFGDMGAVAASSPSTSNTAESCSMLQQSTAPQTTLEMPAEFSNFKVKVEDLEFKIDRLIDKFTLVEDKLRDIENRARGN